MAAAFSHVIFDLDGTILNTLEDLAAAGNHTCEMHGWPTFAVDEYRYKVGNGMLKLVERFMPAEYAGDGRMFEQTLAEFRAYYGEHKEDHTAPYAGTIEMLDRLRAAGVQLAVLTNKDHVSAAPLIEKYFGSERFALVQGRVDAFPPKPEAPVTLHVMEELGANPATTLYVGDSNVDILTGHNAGLKSAGVSWGFRGRAELEAAGADYVVDTQAELTALALGEEWFKELNDIYYGREKQAYALLDALGCKYREHQAGLFVWAELPESYEGDSFAFSDEVMDKCDVFLTPGGIFGSEGNRYIRITLCCPEELLKRATDNVKAAFGK